MKIRFSYFILLLLMAVSTSQLHAAQTSVKQLEKERKETLKKMETTNKMLNETKKSQQSTLNKLNILNNNIRERKTLINTINKEVKQLDNEINVLTQEKNELEKQLEKLKADYARLIQEAYINRNSYNKIIFIFSAENFDQSYRRLRYLQEYSSYRKQQAKEIQRITAEIEERNKASEQHKLSKLSVLQQKEQETRKLARDQQTEKKMLTDLQKKERKLKQDLKTQEKKAAQLNKKIEDMIAEEIRRNEEKQKKAQQKEGQKPTTGTIKPENMLTKEEKLHNGNFESNKGRMPSPVERGFNRAKYGVQPHPVLKHVTVNNKGIYIQTPAKSDARAIFDGEVTQRFSMPGSNNGIIVKHGIYRTVYANLTEMYVNVGDKIKAKQAIGKIYTDDENDNKTELYFQLWKDKTIMDPTPWIAK